MTIYTKRDIRAADILAMILFGFGVVLVLFAILKATGKVGEGGGSAGTLWIVAGVFLLLGGALNLKVRQLIRNKGAESVDYDGAPD